MKKLISAFILLMVYCYLIMPAFALNDENIAINYQTKHLGSRLHMDYCGYIYTIKNKTNTTINIEAISFQDNLTGEAAYLSVKRSSIAAGLKTLGTGVVFAIPTLTLSLFGSVIVAPIKMFCNTCGNIGAKQESKRYSTQISACTLKPHSEIQLKTIAVKHHKPTITIIYTMPDNVRINTVHY